MSKHRYNSAAGAERQYADTRDRLVRSARRTVGLNANILIMLYRRWGDRESVRAARALATNLRSARPLPHRWRLDRIFVALTSGASDVDANARRIAGLLRALASDLDELITMARMLGRPS